MELQITATSEELREYRNYKLDLLNGGKIDLDMEMISHILENSNHNLAQILSDSEDGDDITISKDEVTRENQMVSKNEILKRMNLLTQYRK